MGIVKLLLFIFVFTFAVVFGFLYLQNNGGNMPALPTVPEETVEGIHTKRAEKISGQIAEDIGDSTEKVQKDFLEVTIGDIFTSVSRLQRIPGDIQAGKEAVQDQVTNVLESRKEKDNGRNTSKD